MVLEGRGSGSLWRCAGGIERCRERRAERADGAEKREGGAGIEPSRGHSKPPEGAEALVLWREAQGRPFA